MDRQTRGRRRALYKGAIQLNKKHLALRTMEKKIKRINDTHPIESKYIQLGTLNQNVQYGSPFAICLNNIGEGADETQRIGDILFMKWLDLKFFVEANSNLTIAMLPCYMRVVVVYEKTSLGSLAAFSQVFTSATPNAGLLQRNYLTRDDKRFKILYDSGALEVCGSQSDGAVANTYDGGNLAHSCGNLRNVRINLKNLRTDYSRGNAGTIADIDTGGITMFVFSDSTVASSTYVSWSTTICTDN